MYYEGNNKNPPPVMRLVRKGLGCHAERARAITWIFIIIVSGRHDTAHDTYPCCSTAILGISAYLKGAARYLVPCT